MQDSHTTASVDETAADSSPLRLVPAATMGLPQWLAGRADQHLAAFAAHMTQGLLACSTALGPRFCASMRPTASQNGGTTSGLHTCVLAPPASAWARRPVATQYSSATRESPCGPRFHADRTARSSAIPKDASTGLALLSA